MSDDEQTLTRQQIRRKRKFGEPILPEEEAETDQENRHIIAVRLANSIGALNRVTNLFSARGFNLESVAVGETDDPEVSRLTLATTGNDRIVAQITRQLDGLVDTLDVTDLTDAEHVERELCLLKVRYTSATRSEVLDLKDIFRGRVVNVTPETMIFEVTGPTKKINAFIGMMQKHGIEEVARSGRVAMHRSLEYEAPNPLASSDSEVSANGTDPSAS
ncbi:MAG: acetolactate synthase small subunit [Bacteroidetes bacterium]|jgi:acetolactate synthase-1/3 small subunit|nr:acetolactate synthase small subunit [Bacteroidota bacterium]